MKSSETSAKYSWPRSEQKDEIHDSGDADEDDMVCDDLVEVYRLGLVSGGDVRLLTFVSGS